VRVLVDHWLVEGYMNPADRVDHLDEPTESNLDVTADAQVTDTMLLLYMPPEGKDVLISLPRDTFLRIPGHHHNKLNAAYSMCCLGVRFCRSSVPTSSTRVPG
jgi:anionic cell wall polymer biosynthesis LytR-Cps2A-Psr (LCP) family protein